MLTRERLQRQGSRFPAALVLSARAVLSAVNAWTDDVSVDHGEEASLTIGLLWEARRTFATDLWQFPGRDGRGRRK